MVKIIEVLLINYIMLKKYFYERGFKFNIYIFNII